jgi:hypothetical protein
MAEASANAAVEKPQDEGSKLKTFLSVLRRYVVLRRNSFTGCVGGIWRDWGTKG